MGRAGGPRCTTVRAGPGQGMLGGMDTAEYGPCDTADHIACLRSEGELLAGAAERAGLEAPVPACPGWCVRDLLKHVGYVHRWAAGYVREQHAGWVDRASEAAILAGGPGDDELPGWFREGHVALVRALAAAAPGLNCWAFLPAPSPLQKDGLATTKSSKFGLLMKMKPRAAISRWRSAQL